MNWTHSIPRPPVPQGIKEALKNYPELIQDIQNGLNRRVEKLMARPTSIPPFEEAVWYFEAVFENLYIDAAAELEAAEASRDPQTIKRIKEKRHLFGRTAGAHYWNEDGAGSLLNYFQTYKEWFERAREAISLTSPCMRAPSRKESFPTAISITPRQTLSLAPSSQQANQALAKAVLSPPSRSSLAETLSLSIPTSSADLCLELGSCKSNTL